jgi:hypothetical protein
VNLLKLLPGPNVSGAGISQNFITSGTGRFDDDDFNIRIDHHVSEKLNLFGRYSFADFRQYVPGAFGSIAGGPGLADPLAAVVPGFFRTQARRVPGRGHKVPGLLLHPAAQPNAEVASTRIRSPEVMEVRHTGSIPLDVAAVEGLLAVV